MLPESPVAPGVTGTATSAPLPPKASRARVSQAGSFLGPVIGGADLKIQAFLVEMLFLANKWLVSFACFLSAWSLSFKLAGLLLKPALIVSDALYANVVVQVGLPGLCLTYAGSAGPRVGRSKPPP